MHRRYNRWHSRFDQPDPYGGSYDMTNPQSFNRYAYVQNDPVNFVDPTGLFLGGILHGIGNVVRAIGNWLNSEPASGIGGGGGGHLLGGDPHLLPEAPTGEGDFPQTPAPGFDRDLGEPPPNQPACGSQTCGLVRRARSSCRISIRDPLTVGTNRQAMVRATQLGTRTDNFGYSAPGHSPAPYPQGKGSDRGGIFHIYPNEDATATNVGLYAPAGGSVGSIQTHNNRRDSSKSYSVLTVTFNKGPYAGVTLDFVHVRAGSGDPNAMGSIQIGFIGGLGSIDSKNYIHTHIVTKLNGVRVDPRTVFCKEFGF